MWLAAVNHKLKSVAVMEFDLGSAFTPCQIMSDLTHGVVQAGAANLPGGRPGSSPLQVRGGEGLTHVLILPPA